MESLVDHKPVICIFQPRGVQKRPRSFDFGGRRWESRGQRSGREAGGVAGVEEEADWKRLSEAEIARVELILGGRCRR